MTVTWSCQLPVYRLMYLQTVVHGLQHRSPLPELSSVTTHTGLRSCGHRVDNCLFLFHSTSWSWLLRRHEDVTLRKREQAGKDPGDFLTPADRSSVRWCKESAFTLPYVTNANKQWWLGGLRRSNIVSYEYTRGLSYWKPPTYAWEFELAC